MRIYFKIFALLDLISIFLLIQQVYTFITHWGQIPTELDSQLKVYGTIFIFISLIGTTYGLFFLKKWAAIVYYIQFPLRILLWVFSIGFITILIEWFQWGQTAFDLIFRICMIAEFIRLYFTIAAHRKNELTA